VGEDSDEFRNDFLESKEFNLGYKLPVDQEFKKSKNDLIERVSKLRNYLRLLDISDAIINPELVKKEKRSIWKTQQKKNLLLQKLDKLNDGSYYDVTYILSANGITINNSQEPREIAKSLESNGYLKTMGSSGGLSASITIDGREYLETIDEEPKPRVDETNKPDMNVINQKLDEVIEWLKKNDMGNEIIFDELQEMKDAGEKLDIKNWKQLLKGKLFDLGADKAIGLGFDGIKEIFKIFTGEDFSKLIG
jgi:hypothetical protein